MRLQTVKFWLYKLLIIDCVGCGSLVVHRRGLCLPCENHIFDNYLSLQAEVSTLQSGLRFRFLFHWLPGGSEILSKYVYLLKSPLAEPLWQELARYFVKPMIIKTSTVFIPIPSGKGRKHSIFFAQSLCESFGGKMVLALRCSRLDQREQKHKSKEERRAISFVFNEEFTEQLRLASAIVLIDDVITTGASYEAAYNVLKNHGVCPENIELWSAFYRESTKVDFE